MSATLRAVLGVVIVSLAVIALPQAADAREVYVNGVHIGANAKLHDQDLANATVRFDVNGNIWISAPDYHVQILPGTYTVPVGVTAPTPGSERFYLTWTQSDEIGRAQYDFDIVINGRVVDHVMATDPSGQRDVTAWMQHGVNNVRIIANKNISSGRLSTSDQEAMVVSLGEGRGSGNAVVVDNMLLEMRRSAFDTDTFFADAIFSW